MMDHVVVRVKDFDRSRRFYAAALAPLGYKVAREFPGSMAGAQNTTNQVGSFFSAIVFGYVVKVSGNYDLPLILMSLVLGFGALMWRKIDPTQELVPEAQSTVAGI